METPEWENLISRYADEDLSVHERQWLEDMAARDPQVRKRLDQYRRLDQALDQLGGPVPQVNWDDFDRRLQSKLNQAALVPQKQRRRWRWRRWAPLAAAAAVILALLPFWAFDFWRSASRPIKPAASAVIEVALAPEPSPPEQAAPASGEPEGGLALCWTGKDTEDSGKKNQSSGTSQKKETPSNGLEDPLMFLL